MSEDNYKNYKDLISNVKKLTQKEKQHILNIFKKYNIEYTKNVNGYFFNLNNIDISIIDKVSKCVNLIEEKRELIQNLDKKRDAHLEYYKLLIENKLKDTINLKKKEYMNKLILVPLDITPIIKKKVSKTILLSPDELEKPKQYPKNSVYYRISQIIQTVSRNNKNYKCEKNDDALESFIDEHFDDKFENEHIEDNDEQFEEINEQLEEQIDIDDIDEIGLIEEPNDITENINNSISNNENDIDMETDKLNYNEIVEADSDELDYYRKLLKQNGFTFDDDKNQLIKIEEYIH